MKVATIRTTARVVAIALAAGFMLLPWLSVDAVDPGDHLPNGQDLVDWATVEIDQRVEEIGLSGLDIAATYTGVRDLLGWVEDFNRSQVAPRYRLDGPFGILITDGIADTLSTRLSTLLSEFVRVNQDEKLTMGRQMLELIVTRFPIPPGTFLGFHLQHLSWLYGLQSDSLLAAEGAADPAGVQDGFLRRVWDLCQLYTQFHETPGDRYLCRIQQENWLLHRIVCEECGYRGMDFQNQMTGLREDTTAACREVIRSQDTGREAILKRFACRNWGHIFDVKCPECGKIIHFTVPLPDYKILQRRIAVGEDSIDINRLIKKI